MRLLRFSVGTNSIKKLTGALRYGSSATLSSSVSALLPFFAAV